MVNLGILMKTFSKNKFKLNKNIEYDYFLHLNKFT